VLRVLLEVRESLFLDYMAVASGLLLVVSEVSSTTSFSISQALVLNSGL
jgi:hypothetical protein